MQIGGKGGNQFISSLFLISYFETKVILSLLYCILKSSVKAKIKIS